ncbi:MAG: dihydrofolate reductase [Lachnospiraceae bacterium]|nr:dihydrofolate reductase [Lachnospiraceae bacterium]
MNLIVAVDQNWAIGNKGKLLVSIPNDQKNNFRARTMGNVIVLGRKTMDTFPQRRPLPNRTNIILSRNPEYKVKDAIVLHSLEELKEKLQHYPAESIYVTGGDSIYRQLLPYCDTAYVTMIEHRYDADAFFPNLDQDPDWEMTEESDEMTYFDIPYYFRTYKRRSS